MATYAALVSLMNVLENIQIHPRFSISLDNKQTESLGQKLDFLLDFIENHSHGGSKEAEDLESQIASAAHGAEDVIESHIVDQIRAGSTEESPDFLLDLQQIIQDMDSIKEKVMKVKEERRFTDQQPTQSITAASTRPLTTGKTTMVGFDGHSTQLLDWLTGQESGRKIISVTGMAGIGKTTLARNAYENLFQHFDVRAWATISQKCNVREILLQALSCLEKPDDELYRTTEDHQLGQRLHKILWCRRYLIILDDMWSIEAWDEIKFFFPDNQNRSRLIVTTRQSNVANHFGSSCLIVKFLNEDESWRLFCQKAFAPEGCPPHLEKIGREIVKKCGGLPLSIAVIGGFLGKSPRVHQHWENVEKDISPIVNSAEDNECLDLLSLSYNYLPVCLKPCFLYLGIFPEDYIIRVSRLEKLLVAEGFIKPNKNQSLEKVAKGYIKDLIERNLILVHELGRFGNCRFCRLHDLVRDLCLRIAKKEKFLCIMRVFDTPNIDKERRIIVDGSTEKYKERGAFRTLKSTSLARSIICHKGLVSFKPRLLRVLSEADGAVNTIFLPNKIFRKVNLRFLAYAYHIRFSKFSIPTTLLEDHLSIFALWNVQTLIIRTKGTNQTHVAPSQIWEMPQLRHLKIESIYLPDPPPSGKQDGIVLQNLQTLEHIVNFRWSEEGCKRMPNIKKLRMEYRDSWEKGATRLSYFSRRSDATSLSYYCLYNIGLLSELESLSLYFWSTPSRDDMLQCLNKLPESLKKLCLTRWGLHWDNLTVIGSLPNLEALKLVLVIGQKWNPNEGEFRRLKYLEMDSCSDLTEWNAESSHFPALKKLTLNQMTGLDEIPLDIGDIPTLECIDVRECSHSLAISAMKILQEQEISVGNEGLQVEIRFWDGDKRGKFMEEMEEEGFTCKNFQVRQF